MTQPKIYFQWQNPNLRATIYPYRDEKLRDFLLFYHEIDLMKTMGKRPVPPRLEKEILGERERLQKQIDKAELDKTNTEAKIKALKQQYREKLQDKEVRTLQYGLINQRSKLAGIDAKLRTMKGRRDWYEQNAPDHPYFVKYDTEYQAFLPNRAQVEKEMQTMETELRKKVGPFEQQVSTLEAFVEGRKTIILEASARLKRLPGPDKQGKLTPQAAVRWQVLQYEEELLPMDQDQLMTAVVQRFVDEPGRFPQWLQYMVVHFSGMRYKSAHGSWADPRDLLESLEVELESQRVGKLPEAQLEALYQQVDAELEKKKAAAADARAAREFDVQLMRLRNPYQRLRILQAYQGEKIEAEIKKLNDDQVLQRLKTHKSKLPEWAWKEIVARTDLRLETTDANWEQLSAQEQQERWKYENWRWNQMLYAWTSKDITSWRTQHERTLELVVSRAVCNEVAEHIQHLRGLEPGGGLTAKPPWYLRAQAAQPGKAYFRRPLSARDFQTGASILWLGWVDRQPNAWQIALPLPGIELVPGTERQERKKKDEKRSKEKKRGKVKAPQRWLRWTHEATVVEVAEMADGWYVLTFETGKIGIIRRPLWTLVNTWDVFVGYTPPGKVDQAKVDEMLDWAHVLPPEIQPVMVEAEAQPFEIGMVSEEDTFLAEVHQRWESLTPRQKQVAAHFCANMSVREIATRLDTSTSTIHSHLTNIVSRLGLQDRIEICPALQGIDMAPFLVKSLRRNK